MKDLKTGNVWLRCSVGQAWDPAFDTCTGEIVKLDHAQIAYAITEAKRQLGDNWRLPTRKELESLVCSECSPPKISSKHFPNISPEAYWTGEKKCVEPKNILVSKFHDRTLILKIFSIPIFTSFTYQSRLK